jgi:uncharacterized membrane protein YphA (DoxX/SURF4 family)
MDISMVGKVALGLVVAGILIAFGLQILGDVQGDMTASSAEYNATGKAIEGVGNLAEKLPLIATIVVAVLIIGLLVFGFQQRG